MKNIFFKVKDALFTKSDNVKNITDKASIEEVTSVKVENKEYTDEERNRGVDEVYFAILSNDLDKMLAVTELVSLPKNRHHLLQSIVTESYKLRKEDKFRNICIKFSKIHLDEFSVIAPHLINNFNTTLPRVTTFQYYATLLTEIGEYDEAIKICEMAITFSLDDGTKGGYENRIEKINKKKLSLK